MVVGICVGTLGDGVGVGICVGTLGGGTGAGSGDGVTGGGNFAALCRRVAISFIAWKVLSPIFRKDSDGFDFHGNALVLFLDRLIL